ncbi:MAG: acetyltransferase [Candidatus Omnitrophota bacterium]
MKIKKPSYSAIKNTIKNFVFIGTSSQAKVVYDTFNFALDSQFNLVGFITSDKINSFLGMPVLGNEAGALKIFKKHKITHAFIAIGSGFSRQRINSDLLLKNKISSMNIIHPSAIIEKNVKIGAGSFIGAGVIINSDVCIGNHCLINSGAIIEHDCVIGDFATVSPGAKIGGGVKLGKRSFIGLGANIIHKQCICDDVVIGAGSTVVNDIKARSVAFGCPAKIIKKRKVDDSYL